MGTLEWPKAGTDNWPLTRRPGERDSHHEALGGVLDDLNHLDARQVKADRDSVWRSHGALLWTDRVHDHFRRPHGLCGGFRYHRALITRFREEGCNRGRIVLDEGGSDKEREPKEGQVVKQRTTGDFSLAIDSNRPLREDPYHLVQVEQYLSRSESPQVPKKAGAVHRLEVDLLDNQ